MTSPSHPVPAFRFSRLFWSRVIFALSAAVLLALAIYRCMDVNLNHDEHQFIAPAVLTARQAMVPYRDYALFHQPYQILLNALGISLGGSPLLVGRLVSGLAGAGILLSLFTVAWVRLGKSPVLHRWIVGMSGAFFLFDSPAFTRTTGRAWNHDLPTFLALSAALLAVSAKNPASWIRWLVVGMLGGFAVGCRLTFAPFALLLALVPWVQSGWPVRRKAVLCTMLCLGTLLALLPSLWAFYQAPDDYLFGNFEYASVPFKEGARGVVPPPFSTFQKLSHLATKVVPPNACAVLAILGLGLPTAFWRWRRHREPGGMILFIFAAALLFGATAPARPHPQYFYTPLVFGVAALLWVTPFLNGFWRWIVSGLAVIPLTWQGEDLVDWNDVFRTERWAVSRIHRSALDLKKLVPSGKVLTLSPILPVEAGLDIYPELALGIFGWRSADLFPVARQKELRLIGPHGLETLLRTQPPQAILTGFEPPESEAALVAYAQRHGYRKQVFRKEIFLWLPPFRSRFPSSESGLID